MSEIRKREPSWKRMEEKIQNKIQKIKLLKLVEMVDPKNRWLKMESKVKRAKWLSKKKLKWNNRRKKKKKLKKKQKKRLKRNQENQKQMLKKKLSFLQSLWEIWVELLSDLELSLQVKMLKVFQFTSMIWIAY